MDILDAADVARIQTQSVGKAIYQEECQNIIDFIDLDASTFTHLMPAYQVLAEQSNSQAEQHLNLVHTTESMMRAKQAIATLSQELVMMYNFPVKRKTWKVMQIFNSVVKEEMHALLQLDIYLVG